MDTKVVTIKCNRCGETHPYHISQKDFDSGLIFNLGCLSIKRLPRVTSFRFDFTKNIPIRWTEEMERTSLMFGSFNVDKKNERKNKINNPKLWLIHDFDLYFEEIINAYIMGSFYPVATSCTTLSERLVNLFIFKMKNLYDKSLLDNQLQKYVGARNQNWQSFEKNIKILRAWNLLSANQEKWFNDLLDIRNRAVHFQSSFDPEPDSLSAIETLRKIIDSYFSPFERKDVLRVFEIPGEIWVREGKLNDPFVKAFVLPCCTNFASRGVLNNKNIYHESDAVVGVFSETDFMEQRKNFQGNLAYEPVFKEEEMWGKKFKFRVI